MSTRSALLINIFQDYNEGNPNRGLRTAQYYHHYDGYIEGVGKELIFKFNKLIAGKGRLIDSLYGLESDIKNNFPAAYEHTELIHDDIEFLYTLTKEQGSNNITLCAYDRGGYNNTFNSYDEFILKSNKQVLAVWNWSINSNYYYLQSINYNGKF